MFRRAFILALLAAVPTLAADPWISIKGEGDGPGKGKKVVLVSGDEEYRSEETLPALAKILAKHHGFDCTVLFAIDPKTGEIAPNTTTNIPGLDALDSADLLVICTRFRDLPDEQMKHVVDYVEAGKPVVGLRTATHAFSLKSKTYATYTWNSKEKGSEGGFGRRVLGETWVNHWGAHGSQGTRGIVAAGQEKTPILKGVEAGGIFGTTDVYEAHPTDGCDILVMGEVTETLKPDSKGVTTKKNDPMMPVAWTKKYPAGGGKTGRAFATTMGAATDFEFEGTRRMLVNGCLWAVGLEDKIPAKSNVDLVGEFKGTPFGNNKYKPNVKPEDLLK